MMSDEPRMKLIARIQEFRSSGVQEFRSQNFRISEFQNFRSQ